MLSTGGVISFSGNTATHTLFGQDVFTAGESGEYVINVSSERVNKTYSKYMLRGEQLFSQATSDITYNANATISKSSFKFGYASLYLDGSSYISLADSSDFDFGSGDFTIDFWANISNLTAYRVFIAQRTAYNSNHAYTVFLASSTNLLFGYGTSGGTVENTVSFSTSTLPSNSWFHVAVVRNGSVLKLFINGTQQDSDKAFSSTLFNSTANLTIGQADNLYYVTGYLDEIRLSKGIARWTANFTPLTYPYNNDSYTALLLHFDNTAKYTVSYKLNQPRSFAFPMGLPLMGAGFSK